MVLGRKDHEDIFLFTLHRAFGLDRALGLASGMRMKWKHQLQLCLDANGVHKELRAAPLPPES